MANHRTVVAEPGFEEQRVRLVPSPQLFDEAFRGVEWLLARHPELGNRVSLLSPVWFIQVGNSADVRNLTVYYTFDDTHVYLLFLELTSVGNGDS